MPTDKEREADAKFLEKTIQGAASEWRCQLHVHPMPLALLPGALQYAISAHLAAHPRPGPAAASSGGSAVSASSSSSSSSSSAGGSATAAPEHVTLVDLLCALVPGLTYDLSRRLCIHIGQATFGAVPFGVARDVMWNKETPQFASQLITLEGTGTGSGAASTSSESSSSAVSTAALPLSERPLTFPQHTTAGALNQWFSKASGLIPRTRRLQEVMGGILRSHQETVTPARKIALDSMEGMAEAEDIIDLDVDDDDNVDEDEEDAEATTVSLTSIAAATRSVEPPLAGNSVEVSVADTSPAAALLVSSNVDSSAVSMQEAAFGPGASLQQPQELLDQAGHSVA